jgi:DNA-binding IclR family transcriptional regulator
MALSKHSVDAVRDELTARPHQNVTELALRTGLTRPTVYKALVHLSAEKEREYWPPTYKLPVDTALAV